MIWHWQNSRIPCDFRMKNLAALNGTTLANGTVWGSPTEVQTQVKLRVHSKWPILYELVLTLPPHLWICWLWLRARKKVCSFKTSVSTESTSQHSFKNGQNWPKHNNITKDLCNSVNRRRRNSILTRSWLITYTRNPTQSWYPRLVPALFESSASHRQ